MFYSSHDFLLRKYFGWTTNFLLLGLVLGLFAVAFWYFVAGWNEFSKIDIPRQISVSGEGRVAVKPDVATFIVGIVTHAKRVGTAQLENTEKSNATLNFLKITSGVAERDIKTIGYSILPQYQYFDLPPCFVNPCPAPRPPDITSYEVRHTIEVKVRDLGKVDDLLSGVVVNGANEVGSINFSVDKIEEVRKDARKKAIEDAKIKAQVLAEDLDVRLRRIVGYSEQEGDLHVFARTFETKGGFGGDIIPPAPKVESGGQEVRVVVSVIYEFR